MKYKSLKLLFGIKWIKTTDFIKVYINNKKNNEVIFSKVYLDYFDNCNTNVDRIILAICVNFQNITYIFLI